MLWFVIPLLVIVFAVGGYMVWWVTGLLVMLVVDFFLILWSVRIVKPNTARTVEFLWKFNRILRQGFHLIIPILEQTKLQYLYKRNFSVKVEWVTADNVTCYIGLNVISYVNDDDNDSREGNIYRSVYSIDDPVTMIKATIDEQLRGMIVEFDHKEIFSKRQEIWQEIEEKLRVKLKSFGYRLDSIQVRDVILDDTVMTAMNRVVESLKIKEAAYNEAEAEKIKQVKAAEADKESKILIGEGMAGQRMKIAEGFKESVALIQEADKALTGDIILEFLLDSSRIETLWNIWNKNNNKLIYLNENLEGKETEKLSKLIAGSDIMNNSRA